MEQILSAGNSEKGPDTPCVTCKYGAISPIYPTIGEGGNHREGYDWVGKEGGLAMLSKNSKGLRGGTKKRKRDGLSLNGMTVVVALAAGLYWTWWDSFHEVSRFADRLFGVRIPLLLFGNEVYLSCAMKPLGMVVGCLVVYELVRRSRFGGMFPSRTPVIALVAVQAVLHVAYYGLLQCDLRVASFALYGAISASVVPPILLIVLSMERLGERRAVAVIMGALAIYGLIDNVLFPYAYAMLGTTAIAVGAAYAAVLLLGAACLLRLLPETRTGSNQAFLVGMAGNRASDCPVEGDGDGSASVSGCGAPAKTPLPLLFHLIVYGAVFGILHILEGYVQQGPFSINLGVFFGCLVTMGLLAILFFAMGHNHELWSKMRSTVFPLAIVGYLLIPLASNSDFALAFTEAGNLLYLSFLFIGCLSLIHRTAVDPRAIVLRAVMYNSLGTALGILLTVNFAGGFVPGSQGYFVLSIVVTLLLTAATFWVGTDEQIRKIWGLRRKMSAKRYNDAATKARVSKLAGQHGLTPREADILMLIAQGRRAPEMTDALGVSMGTVRTHVKHLYTKLGVHSYAEAVKALEDVSLDEGELRD